MLLFFLLKNTTIQLRKKLKKKFDYFFNFRRVNFFLSIFLLLFSVALFLCVVVHNFF